MSARQELLDLFYNDRPLAHATLFAHRHPNKTPDFHEAAIRDWHGPHPRVLDMFFRGAAKSTLSEEAVVILAGFREFKNCLIVGENYDRAAARLHAIRREIESNELVAKVFGDLRGPLWGEDRIILPNGATVQALGKGQSLRGIKHEDMRPDLVFADDLENRGDVVSPEARRKTFDWFTLDLLPACDPSARVRVDATPLHPDALPMVLKRDPGWLTTVIPIYYLDEDGERVSSWPDRYPIGWIDSLEESYKLQGQVNGFRQEYMCEAEAPETKSFKQEMFIVYPRVRTWEAVYSMTDPARTTAKTAATTGRVVWSWIGHKLVIWDAVARRWMPNEIIDDLFYVDETYHPVAIGFEEDGLNQWALQAIRQEQVRRGHVLPLKPVKAPVGKLDFIRGLQVYFQAREVEFAKPLPELQSQLLGFPNGDIDAPNALAYAPRMRPGAPIYDDFGVRNVGEDLRPAHGTPVWLVLNAARSVVTGAVLQVIDGAIRIYADYVREGESSSVASDVIAAARLDVGRDLRLTAGPLHFSQYNNVGLRQAIARLPAELRAGVEPERGRSYLRHLLQTERRGMPALMVSSAATWTLRAFSGGYARVLQKQGVLADHAEEGEYRVLMEGIESFVGLLELGFGEDEERGSFNAETAQGRPYRSMIAGATTVRDSKSDWNSLLRGGR